MKIVQINAVYGFSSTGRTTQEMHEFLIKRGYQSFVFCRNTHSPENDIFKVGNTLSYRVHAVLSRLFSLQGFGSFFSTINLVNQLKRINPDIVILRNLHENYINLPILLNYLAKNKIRVILVLHDCWIYTGGCAFYSYNKCDKWKESCENCKFNKSNGYGQVLNLSSYILKQKRKLFSKIEKLYVVGVSEWSVKEARQSFLSDSANGFRRIYNWIDHEKFYPRENDETRKEYGIPDDAFLVVCAAQNWNKKKGVDVLPEIAAQLPDACFIIIGNYKSNPKDNMICAGQLGDVEKLANIYSAADLFVNLSQEESFGKVSAEALSCGTPVITNRLTANPEIVEWDDFIIEKYNADSYVKAIKQHKINKENNKLMSQKCQNLSERNYSMQNNMQSYIDLFEEII